MSTSTHHFTAKLRGSSVLIIGGTSGVGLGTAAALLEAGANVILSSSRSSKLSEAMSSLRSSHPDLPTTAIAGFTCDLASPEVESNLQTLYDQVSTHLRELARIQRSGQPQSPTKESEESEEEIPPPPPPPPLLNHLIYTAGDRLPTMPLSSITLSRFNSALQVRSLSALLSIKTFSPLLPRSNHSSIVLTSGSICEKPIPAADTSSDKDSGWSILAFIGAGLTGLTRQLALDLSPLRVNCVAPGVVDTDLWSHMNPSEKEEFYRSIEKTLPTGKISGPEEIAESYLYLLRARNVTGSIVHTNGGAFL